MTDSSTTFTATIFTGTPEEHIEFLEQENERLRGRVQDLLDIINRMTFCLVAAFIIGLIAIFILLGASNA